MEKSNIVNIFTGHIEQLRTTECSQKEKIACFQQIAECIMSPALAGHINYLNHCTTAVNVLLLFCEDLDSVVRMSAEENLNKIFRSLEKNRVSRIIMDLYGEIKRNGNQRSLRICLNLFAYYAPRIKEKTIKSYAVRLLACMQVIARRKETQLQETLCEFVKCFGRYLQVGLTDSETCKLFEVFIENIGAECAVKRRCSSQNCISLIENSRNKSLMARHGLNQVIDLLLADQQTHSVLGCLGFLRVLLPLIIRGFPDDCPDDGDWHSHVSSRSTRSSCQIPPECRQIVEIYDYCLHLLNISHPTSGHGLINAALEVLHSVLQTLEVAVSQPDGGVAKTLHELLFGGQPRMQQQRRDLLRRRKSLKNQIFQLHTDDEEDAPAPPQYAAFKLEMLKVRPQQTPGPPGGAVGTASTSEEDIGGDGKQSRRPSTTTSAMLHHQYGHIRHATARSISECVDDDNLLATVVGSVEDDTEPPPPETEAKSKAIAANDDDDAGADNGGAGELEVDDFITFPKINEPPPPPSSSASRIDVDNLMDAMLHDVDLQLRDCDLLGTSAPDDKSQHFSDMDNESFNSIDFEAEITIGGSGRVSEAAADEATDTAAPIGGASGGKPTSGGDSIGTFFNNLITHSNAATESVSKLFRPSSGPKGTPTKSPVAQQPDKSDTLSMTTSLSGGDTLSFTSTASSNRRVELDASDDPQPQNLARKPSDVSSCASNAYDDTFSRSASVTASTAVLADSNTRNTATAAECSSDEEADNVLRRDKNASATHSQQRVPNVNPFLKDSSPLKQSQPGAPLLTLKIGSIYEQPLVTYTVRLTAARFLLTGQLQGLHEDATIRVSIKSLSLMVIAQCIRLQPEILQLLLEITEEELKSLLEAEKCEQLVDSSSPKHSSSGDSSSNLSRDYEHLEANPSEVSHTTKKSKPFPANDELDDALLLDIKDDHFGPSTCDYKTLFNDPLSRSADPVMLGVQNAHSRGENPDFLSKSEIVSLSSTRHSPLQITQAYEDQPPSMEPPRPPKRTKSIRKLMAGGVSPRRENAAFGAALQNQDAPQPLADVLLFYKHSDPILRGGVQLIIGNFVEASGAGLAMPLRLDLQRLLAMLLKGLEDDIHTVVIQALNAFDKMLPHVIAKYLTEPACHYPHRQQWQRQQQQHPREAAGAAHQEQHKSCKETSRKHQVIADGRSTSAQPFANDAKCPRPSPALWHGTRTPDEDELLDALLLGDPQMRIPSSITSPRAAAPPPTKVTNVKSQSEGAPSFLISPKLLLDKVRLCRHNKYWLVQNKYAEVISNLNFIPIGHYYNGDDTVAAYEHLFLDELLTLIADDDVRVREHAAMCLCRFIILRSQQQQREQQSSPAKRGESSDIESHASTAGFETNFTLLADFLDYRLFSGMSAHLRQLFVAYGGSSTALNCYGLATSTVTSCMPPPPTSAYGSPPTTTAAKLDDGLWHAHFSSAHKRHPGREQKLLSKVLYRLANKLMALHDKNLQFGVIYTLKLLLHHFNWLDYEQAWREFNFLEVAMKFTYYNFVTASDLNCQNDLIEIAAKMMAGRILSTDCPSALMQSELEQLMQHTLKILNIYYHLFTNQRPLLVAKSQKPDIFVNAKELAIMQSTGYFGNDYVYIKLYNILRSANDSYKITINQESGSLLIGLLRTCLSTLSVCLELHAHDLPSAAAAAGMPSPSSSSAGPGAGVLADGNFPSNAVLKLIEEILQYLGKLINYAPGECIGCLKQLLKYLFAQNYGNRHQDYYAAFVRPYFGARHKSYDSNSSWQPTYPAATINYHRPAPPPPNTAPSSATATPVTQGKCVSLASESTRSSDQQRRNSIVSAENYDDGRPSVDSGGGGAGGLGDDSKDDYRLLGELLINGLQLHTWKSERESEYSRHIKMFEPMVIYSMQLFLKMNASVQAPILELLSQLLDLNVTYSVLDSKNVIFDQITNTLELIESGNVKNAHLIIPPIMKFLMQLTHKSDRKLITIPKLISVANSLLANSAIRDCSVQALKALVYELFFVLPASGASASGPLTAEATEKRAHFQSPITVSPVSTPGAYHRRQEASPAGARALPLGDTVPGAAASAAEDLLAQQRELDTQKEVVLGMLEKFIDTGVCQRVLGLLLLRERCNQQMDEATLEQGTPHKGRTLTRAGSGTGDTQPVYTLICRSICEGRYRVDDWRGFYALDAFFRNNGRNVLADSKEFLALLQLLITKDVAKFCDLSYATLILANVILKTEEIYLVNHIKLYLRNHPASGREGLTAASRVTECWLGDGPSTSTAAAAAKAAVAASTSASYAISEINYFGKVLVEKLLTCLDTLIGLVERHPYRPTRQMSLYCGLVQRFVRAVHDCCFRSRHKDALQSVFRLMLAESEFLDKYYNLIMMHGTPICCWPLVAASLTSSNECAAVNGGSAGTLLALQVEVFKLLSAMKMVTSFTFLLPKPHHQHQQQQQQQPHHQQQQRTLAYLERRMLAEILYMHGAAPINWKLQQVQHLFDARFVHILITDHFEFVCDLCKVDEQFCVAWLDAVLQSISDRDQAMPKPFVRLVLQQFGRLCPHFGGHAETVFKSLQVLDRLHYLERGGGSGGHRWQLERLARRLSSQVSNGAEQQRLAGLIGESSVNDGCQLMVTISRRLNDLDGTEISTTCRPTDTQVAAPMQTTTAESRIIDEKWLFAQLIKFSSDSHLTDPRQLARILLEIQSENKLHTIFQNASFDASRLLRHAIVSSSEAMLASFRNNCVQHNPHIHYLQPNPLVRVTSAILMAGLKDCTLDATDTSPPDGQGLDLAPWQPARLAVSVIALIECVERIERAALIYIDARFVDKFVREQLLRAEMVSTLARFLVLCCRRLEALMASGAAGRRGEEFHALLRCIEALLRQKLVWHEVNRQDSGTAMADAVVQLAGRLATQVLRTTSFCRKFNGCAKNTIEDYAVFTAQLIETQTDSVAAVASGPSANGCDASCELLKGCTASKEVMECLVAIGISVLRTDQFYAYAVTPYEIVQQQQRERLATGGSHESPTKRQTAGGNAKLPTIAVESLSDVEILRKFVKRLSIFGFTTRQQFEEYFMTFLLLINKVYDEHMVDEQEQYQIKSTCLEAILELLITYKTFPIVGSSNKLSQFHHTTRLARINCESICLKKLHKVQLLISDMNLFYHPNMERQLSAPADNIIGTRRFDLNQYDLHFVWQQMEAYAQLTPSMGDAADRRLTAQLSGESVDDNAKTASVRNYRYFTQESGVDFKSSSQLIFDVLMQILEYNHILALPNLVKFCEICESRDQIKWIKDKVARLQESTPMDDTISHQYIIYLLCRTQATLIPSLSQLQHLCSLIGAYLKSSHVFIRNAALAGLLCLLESSSKTNTTIGKLSDELSLLRDLIVGYINRHGFLKESSMQCSNTHTKLVWTLNYCLIEWTSKFVPQCNLLANTVAAATNILKKTTNEELYLTILHGLERIVVVTNAPSPGGGEAAGKGDQSAAVLRHKIEKLAVDLLKAENERFAIPALKLLLSCIYVGSAKQLENTELSNGIVQDDPEIIAQQTDKVDMLLHCIKSSTREAAWIYGQVLCQIIRDLVPPKEILTKVIKEFVAINQPHCDVIAMVVHQVFRSAIDSSDLQMLQDWLICTLPTFLGLPERKAVWGLSVIFLSASINLHLIKLFPVVLGTGTGAGYGYGTGQRSHTQEAVYGSATQGWAKRTASAPPSVSLQQQQQQKLGQHEIALFVTAAQDFHIKLSSAQRMRFQDAFKKFQQNEVYARLLHSLH